MGSKYVKRYTEEFKWDAIALVDSSGRTVTAVARELGNPDLARPGRRPRRGLQLHRDLLQPPPPAQAQIFGYLTPAETRQRHQDALAA
ncbi:transposase [Streptomyces sp. MH13]|uniref:transposase n=1 Tax=Streptomyces sp. MH13 TaxID=3417651 RepID=UPI003CEA40D3